MEKEKEHLDPAMAIMMGLDEIDTASVVRKEQEDKKTEVPVRAKPSEQPKRKPPVPSPGKRNQVSASDSAEPQSAAIRISARVLQELRLMMHIESARTGRRVTQSELISALLSEHLESLPEKQRKAFEALS